MLDYIHRRVTVGNLIQHLIVIMVLLQCQRQELKQFIDQEQERRIKYVDEHEISETTGRSDCRD